jgi:tetratricopeptide (TPR) repeat protein
VLRADLHSAKKDWDQAGADIEIALELDPGNAHALLIRGTLWLESGSAALAAQALSELLKKDPKNTRALLLRATANEHLLDHDKAIADYRTVLKIDPRNAGATRSIKRIGAYQKSLKR